jgi:hypothetical protein
MLFSSDRQDGAQAHGDSAFGIDGLAHRRRFDTDWS